MKMSDSDAKTNCCRLPPYAPHLPPCVRAGKEFWETKDPANWNNATENPKNNWFNGR